MKYRAADLPQKSLSPRQLAVLECIQSETSQLGRPPTYREIAKQLGDVAVGTIQDHIRALIKKGFLEKLEGLSRGFRLVNQSGALQVPILGRVARSKRSKNLKDPFPFLLQCAENFSHFTSSAKV
jgi:SOS-response transcriptional repressor LexA